MLPRVLGRSLSFCLVISAAASCRTSASPKGDRVGPAVKPPLVAADPQPSDARSKWARENSQLQKTALARAGLSAVRLESWQPRETRRNDPSTPWHGFGPEVRCKLLQNLPGAPPRLLFNPGGVFAVSADGKVRCVLMEYQELSPKKETIAGLPPDCGGGAYREAEVNHHLYVIPEGVPVGEAQSVRVPYHELDIRYETKCTPVPSARF